MAVSILSVAGGPGPRTNAVFATDGKSLLVFGGLNTETGKVNDLFELTLDPPTWHAVAQKGQIPCARDSHAFVYIPSEEKYYLFGGSSDEDKELNDLFSYDPRTHTWSQLVASGSPSPRSSHGAAVLGSSLYVYGGFCSRKAVGDLYQFDAKTGKWAQLPAGGPRCNHTLTAIGSNLYAFGGRVNAKTLFNDIAAFNTTTATWAAVTPTPGVMPSHRDMQAAVAVNKSLVIFGGAFDNHADVAVYHNDCYVFDTESNTWKALALNPAPPPRAGSAAALVGAQILLFGGAVSDSVELADLVSISAHGLLPDPPRRAAPTIAARRVPPPPVDPPQAKYERTPAPTLSFATATPVPSARRTVECAPASPVPPRDLDRHQRDCSDMVAGLFRLLRDEFQEVDTGRVDVAKQREALAREKAENETLFARQQAELAEQLDRHKRETEEWIAQRRKENDEERRRLAEEWAQLKRDREQHKSDVEKLTADRAALEGRERQFEEKSKKMEGIMAQFKGLA
eukprot:m.221735 g.221735  ORF g.221735 m.221735 type:complete len:511 (+) comp15874_c0_seq1:1258-2790(+)